jgi:DNA-directed RNA polymerase subunit RPC12/RpoP
MRITLRIAAIVFLLPVLVLVGCKQEEVAAPPPPPPPDPGWPTISTQDAAVQFDLEEAHYHMRKGRATAPDSYGAEQEMPFAVGYAQWAYEMQPDSNAAMATVDHLTLENGSHFDVPFGYPARCMFCGYAMPKSFTRWHMQGNEKSVECPKCGAANSFPQGLVLQCPVCHDLVAGTAAGGAKCPTCGRQWRSLLHSCSNCGLQVSMTARQGQRCPRCHVKWNFDVPFGNWPTRAKPGVTFTGSGKGVQCEGYTATGQRCPNKTERAPGEDGKAYCWIHRNQAARDKAAAAAPTAPAAAAGPGAGPGAGGPPGPGPGPGPSPDAAPPPKAKGGGGDEGGGDEGGAKGGLGKKADAGGGDE